MPTYAIGDLQGCYKELMLLLEKLEFSDTDQLWLVGDLVNRGPNSLSCLRFIKQLDKRAKVVLGNHDLHLLALYYQQATAHKSDTLNDILNAPDIDELMHWLKQQPLFIADQQLGYAMVHAGVPPNWSYAEAEQYAAEVQQALSQEPKAYFQHMYGNQPDKWQQDLQGYDRLRLITNYLTRMRFCSAAGQLNLEHKGEADSAPDNYAPWFQYPRQESLELVFGHWAALEGNCTKTDIFALDTGCVWGNQLTAMRLQDKMRFTVDNLT